MTAMQPPKVLPPHYFIFSVLLMIAIAMLLGGELLGTDVVYLGAVPMLVGVVIAAIGSRQFSIAGTNIIPLSESTALVTNGIFKYSRNPMYTGMILFLAGLALLLDNAWNWVVVVGFTILIRQWFVLREEILMEQTFGAGYTAYQARVRRWV